MNRERAGSVIVAIACITAMGVASTTLESTLSSDPDDAIQLDYDTLPIGKEQASEMKQEVQRNEQRQQSESSSSTTKKQEQQQQQQQQQQKQASAPDQSQDLLDTLLALLKELLPYIVGTLLLLTVGGLAYHYRERLMAPLLALLPQFGGGRENDAETGVTWHPRDDAERAWLDLLQAAGVDNPQSKTPTECADAAVDSGFDPEPVHKLRRAFEEIRYGETTLSEEHRERVTQSRRQLGLRGHQ